MSIIFSYFRSLLTHKQIQLNNFISIQRYYSDNENCSSACVCENVPLASFVSYVVNNNELKMKPLIQLMS